VLSKDAKQRCQAGIRCGFPVKKSFSVGIKYRSGGRAVGISGCCAGAVPSKQASKQARLRCLVKCCAGAKRISNGQGLCAGSVRVRVLSCNSCGAGAKQTNKQG